MNNEIVVVGSANLDIVVPVPHHPVQGETVLGGDHQRIPGGKGANQAVAAARLGGRVGFVGRVGADAAGAELRSSLLNAGVDCESLVDLADKASGIALITVGPDGDNAIVVSPGANAHLHPADVEAHSGLTTASIVLLQLEIPMDTTISAARKASGNVLLDPAPAPASGLPRELLDEVDVVMPNETELGILAQRDVDANNEADLIDAARSLDVAQVVVTLGPRGALVIDNEVVTAVPAPTITAVDTTAAGDAFRAAMAVGLAKGESLHTSATTAVRVGAATALRFGAQPSLPTPSQVNELLR